MRHFLSVFGLMLPMIGLAQTPSDANALRRQIEPEHLQALPRNALMERPQEPAARQKPKRADATVKSFLFAGNSLLTAEQLSSVVADHLGQPLKYVRLQAAATAVVNAYREAGWIVRAYLPGQDITGGIITIQIVEPVLGGGYEEYAAAPRLKLSHVLELGTSRQQIEQQNQQKPPHRVTPDAPPPSMQVPVPVGIAAESSSPNAMTGRGVPQEDAEALKQYRRAADQGDAMAQSNLGLLYQEGRGTLQDYAQAAKWFRLAASRGDVSGQRYLGLLYRDGNGVAENPVIAYAWLNLATAAGHPKAFAERNAVAKKLTAQDLLRAQQLSAEWGKGALIAEDKPTPDQGD